MARLPRVAGRRCGASPSVEGDGGEYLDRIVFDYDVPARGLHQAGGALADQCRRRPAHGGERVTEPHLAGVYVFPIRGQGPACRPAGGVRHRHGRRIRRCHRQHCHIRNRRHRRHHPAGAIRGTDGAGQVARQADERGRPAVFRPHQPAGRHFWPQDPARSAGRLLRARASRQEYPEADRGRPRLCAVRLCRHTDQPGRAAACDPGQGAILRPVHRRALGARAAQPLRLPCPRRLQRRSHGDPAPDPDHRPEARGRGLQRR
ncbi:hypothetical protein D9M72_398830 [compost metagenome]